MTHIRYEIVQHDGGWAYKLGDVFSETHATHEGALRAAREAAARQTISGETRPILFQDSDGHWHEETAQGTDRPDAEIDDTAETAAPKTP
ncbi:DUF2188 domain-containing protein [Ancylobacter pratisalsi]|uniref:DUF2188 domain-containing protein n=1 Tax=Ancylobacter pratisalsi TaxID=1745854 RepID=A0A6P1YSE6_9HYPH|nr:DUF2188 domain-containing protein [Ancylobacter pratisalsi]QIB34983.1 DUF2188 domain-containing protein [Ancylobacter pratisalsi]